MVRPEDELAIGRIIEDLRWQWEKSEKQVLALLSEIIEDADKGRNIVQAFAIAIRKTKSWNTNQNKEVEATMYPRLPVTDLRGLAYTLLGAANKGLNAARELRLEPFTIQDGDAPAIVAPAQSIPLRDIIIGRVGLIEALEKRKLSVPTTWTGRPDVALTGTAIRRIYKKVGDEKWEDLFERDDGVKACRLPDSRPRKPIFSRARIERYLIKNGYYYSEDEMRAEVAKAETASPSGILGVTTHKITRK